MFSQSGRSYARHYVIPQRKEVPDVEQRDDPMVLNDWLASTEDFFFIARVRSKMNLVGLAQRWYGVEGDI